MKSKLIENLNDDIKESFYAHKIKHENGLYKDVHIYPFKMASGAIISAQLIFSRYDFSNELDMHNYIEQTVDYKIFTTDLIYQPINIQIKQGDLINYSEIANSHVLELFRSHGGIDIKKTLGLRDLIHQIKPPMKELTFEDK